MNTGVWADPCMNTRSPDLMMDKASSGVLYLISAFISDDYQGQK
jgi:hypothetical protein